MEAMWARFVPWAVRLRELLADGRWATYGR